MSSRNNKLSISTSEDERKRRRMISNRESAKRSRVKREQHVKDLNDQIMHLSNKCSEMNLRINEITPVYEMIASENRILRLQSQELRARLESLKVVGRSSGYMNEPSTTKILEHPWSQPIMTSAGIFQT